MTPNALPARDIPEMRAMLLCSKLKPEADDIKTILTLFSPSFDWDRFIILMQEHRLFPPVYETLKNHLKDKVPADAYKRIEIIRKKNLHKCLTNIAVAVKISRLFNENDIDHLFLKGICLSQLLYGHPCSRYAGDIDLIVSEHMFDKAITLFEEKGYEQVQSETRLTPENKGVFLDGTHHLSFQCPDSRTKIELHFRFHNVSGYYPMDFAQAWKQKLHITINGYDLPVMSDHHTLINLSLHGSGHFWTRLFWLKDISDYFRVYRSTNEYQFFDAMSAKGLSRPAAEMLYFLNIFFGHNIPEEARRAIKNDWFLRLAPRIMDYILKYPQRPLTLIFKHFHGIFTHQDIRFNLEKIKIIILSKYHKKTYNPKDKSRLLKSIAKR